jgi:serine/threonine protein kinase/tetratricopeptide (TPR) repeat protein
MIGRIISHYKILEKLGEGGMGVVYKAEDTKLGRPVALKFLPASLADDPQTRERFAREARAAAALNHPNICTIHEVDEQEGRAFIVMELVQGIDLRTKIRSGPLELGDALDIAVQIAEGVARAHEAAIVHRDIKPANVMVTPDGRVKIMDFGLARLGGCADLTTTGTTVGTAAYMSPEQVRGHDVDHRSDIWSLGAVLYEMLTGKKPFQGDHQQAVLYGVLNEEPAPVRSVRAEAPIELESIIGKMLTKDRSLRYQTTREALDALRAIYDRSGTRTTGSIGEKPKPTIAVMPFVDMSPGKDQEFFCDGMAEEIINALTHVSGLRVIARTSAFAFRGQDRDIREIGSKLSAGTVLEGSVRKAGNRIRVTAQLISVSDGCHVWSERYDRELEDVFAVQDEIAAAIAEKLRVELTPEEGARLATPRSVDPRAHEALLRGRHYWSQHWQGMLLDPESPATAIGFFERAVEIDPTYALAHADLASLWSLLCRWSSPRDNCERARAAAKTALELDPLLAEAHSSMGAVLLNADGDWSGAKREHQRAIELNPGSAIAHLEYGTHLAWEGWYDEAIAEMRKAIELDPLDYMTNMSLAFTFHIARRYEDAQSSFARVLELFPGDRQAELERAASRVYSRTDLPGAAAALEKLNPNDIRLAVAYAWMERRDDALRVLDWWKAKDIEDVPYRIARIHAALGERDEAFTWLETTFETKPLALLQINSDPELDYLRPDPRFRDLVQRAGIPSGQLEGRARQQGQE